MPHLTGAQKEALRARLEERSALLRNAIEQPRDAAELNAVLEALLRIEEGGYGLCADCGTSIAFERLAAQPQAPRCIRCETEHDRVRARPGPPAL